MRPHVTQAKPPAVDLPLHESSNTYFLLYVKHKAGNTGITMDNEQAYSWTDDWKTQCLLLVEA